MPAWLSVVLAVGLTVLLLLDTAWQVRRLQRQQPTRWWGLLLLLPILWLLPRLAAMD